jgi:hypothetical protein
VSWRREELFVRFQGDDMPRASNFILSYEPQYTGHPEEEKRREERANGFDSASANLSGRPSRRNEVRCMTPI